MVITVRRTQTGHSPTAEEPGAPVWTGGDTGEEPQEDQLPGSLLESLGIEVGVWYDLDSFCSKACSAKEDNDIWTEVMVRGLATDSTRVSVPQGLAVKMLLTGLIDLLHQVSRSGRLWVRVE